MIKKTTNNIILTDADGVLLDWWNGFNDWAQDRGLVRLPDTGHLYSINDWYGLPAEEAMRLVHEFNTSARMGFLKPYKDAAKYVKLLAEVHGFRFIVITSMGDCPFAKKLRWRNLQEVFGPYFNELIVNDILEPKGDIIAKYEPTIWIEDHADNADAGVKAGHWTFLLEHNHNRFAEVDPRITRVKDWQGIYEKISLEDN